MQIEGTDSSPNIGYPIAIELLARCNSSPLFLPYNDISAIGSTWAFRDAGFRMPEDISVVGLTTSPERPLPPQPYPPCGNPDPHGTDRRTNRGGPNRRARRIRS